MISPSVSNPGAPPLPFDDVSNVLCNGCGVYDGSLRYSVHPRVVAGRESSRMGIWCGRCRGMEAANAAAVSLLAGWWSLRGPARALAAVRKNLQGGEQPATANAKMLRAIALLEYQKTNYDFAVMFAAAANTMQPQRENSRLLHELNRAGYKSSGTVSPWRFAAWVPVAVFAAVVLFLGARGYKALTAPGADPSLMAPVQRASIAGSAPKKPAPAKWTSNANADELQQMLTPDSDERLAAAYVHARLKQVRAEIPARVRHGDPVGIIEQPILDFRTLPAVSAYIAKGDVSVRYARLTATFDDVARYYHGGADAEALERTAGESLKATEEIALGALDAGDRGLSERAGSLANQADQRLASVEQMRQELRLRGAVIPLLTKAIDDFTGR